jgi:L-asparaginase II
VSGPVVLARLVRSGLEESIHLGHVVACDPDGAVVASAGDPGRVLFARSSLKPLQAAVALEALEGVHLEDRAVAVMCGSHNGEPMHVDAVAGLLAQVGLDEAALRCPAAWPRLPEDVARAGRIRPIFHNCSGKHAGMLVASEHMGWDTQAYLDPSHPLQSRIREAVRACIGVDGPPAEGVDGCGAPIYAMTLAELATLFAQLATGRTGRLEPFAARALDAMRREPYLVAGRDRVDTALMEATEELVVKGGAEGLVCAASPQRGIGVAVRVDDGSPRAVAPALLHALRSLEVVHDAQVEVLERFARPPVLGGGGPVGALTSDFLLHST